MASNVSESNLSEIHGWLIEHCLNIYVARNDPDCVSSGDDYDKNNTIGSVAVPMRQGSNDNEKVKEMTDEFGRFVDVYSPTEFWKPARCRRSGMMTLLRRKKWRSRR